MPNRYETDSIPARIKSAAVVASLRPLTAPVAQSLQIGARSPARNGSTVSPCESGSSFSAQRNASLSNADPVRSPNQSITLPPLLIAAPITAARSSSRYVQRDSGVFGGVPAGN